MTLKIGSHILKNYFQPWPLHVPKNREFSVYFIPFEEALKIPSCWKDKRGRRWPIGVYAKRIEEDGWQGKNHQIRSMARSVTLPMPRIVLANGQIYDGNHTMCAWWLRKQTGFPVDGFPTHVMVIEALPKEE